VKPTVLMKPPIIIGGRDPTRATMVPLVGEHHLAHGKSLVIVGDLQTDRIFDCSADIGAVCDALLSERTAPSTSRQQPGLSRHCPRRGIASEHGKRTTTANKRTRLGSDPAYRAVGGSQSRQRPLPNATLRIVA
jgi:hypothetical protein